MSQLCSVFALIKAAELFAVIISPSQFDVSTITLLQEYTSERSVILDSLSSLINTERIKMHVLDKLLSWDSVYFFKLTFDGIAFEHEWVFGPLLWRLLGVLMKLFSSNIYDALIVSMIINNICHFLSCVLLRKLTLLIFGPRFKSKKLVSTFANTCSLLCAIQPSGIFSTVGYSESVSQLFCYLGLYYRAYALTNNVRQHRKQYLLSGICFSIAFGYRSNCLLYGILYLYDLFNAIKHRTFVSMLMSLISGLLLFASLYISVALPYLRYCPERGEWCQSITKSLVTYAQSYYWNVGFLKYFTLGNIPLFLIAMPQLLVLILSLIRFKACKKIRGEWLVCFVYTFLQFTTMHVQIVNRVSTCTFLHIWFLSSLLYQDAFNGNANANKKKQNFLFSQRFAHWMILFWMVWVIVQAGLYAVFLPPA